MINSNPPHVCCTAVHVPFVWHSGWASPSNVKPTSQENVTDVIVPLVTIVTLPSLGNWRSSHWARGHIFNILVEEARRPANILLFMIILKKEFTVSAILEGTYNSVETWCIHISFNEWCEWYITKLLVIVECKTREVIAEICLHS